MNDHSDVAVLPLQKALPRSIGNSWQRIHGFCQRKSARIFFRRPLRIQTDRPLISFTFDDFPESALNTGGEILRRFGAVGTYYAVLGQAGQNTATGKQFEISSIKTLLDLGHELGCHTFSHSHSWNTASREFEEDVERNQKALSDLVPKLTFKTFSYPISPPRPFTKARVARRFMCCRGGGQTFNAGVADLNHVSAFFLEKSSRNPQAILDMIDRNKEARGWLIFATHDVSNTPTPFGVVPELFEDVVRYSVNSGARVLPVAEAVDLLQGSAAGFASHGKSVSA